MKKISERANELQLVVKKEALLNLRKQSEANGFAISDEDWHEATADLPELDAASMRTGLIQALDEWQASAEERFESIGLALVDGTHGEDVIACGIASPSSARLSSLLKRDT